MNYAKIIHGLISCAPNPILHNGLWYGNPPAEVCEAEGYKALIYTEPPEVDPGYIPVPHWTEQEGAIVQIWTQEPEPDEISEDRAWRILTGEEE